MSIYLDMQAHVKSVRYSTLYFQDFDLVMPKECMKMQTLLPGHLSSVKKYYTDDNCLLTTLYCI